MDVPLCRFSPDSWEVQELKSPKKIERLLASLQLEGRVIEDIRFIGQVHNLTREALENRIYQDFYKGLDIPSVEDIPDDYKLEALAEIDEPMLIRFQDGDILACDIPWECEYRFGMNDLDWSIQSGKKNPNLDARVLFRDILRHSIQSVKTDVDALYLAADDVTVDAVRNIRFIMDNGLALQFAGWFDYGEISLIEKEKPVSVDFSVLKQGLMLE